MKSRSSVVSKPDVVKAVAEAEQITHAAAKTIIEAFFRNIFEGLKAGHAIELRDFGVFKAVQRKAKRGRNPKTGQLVMIPARRRVKFIVGANVRKAIQIIP